MILTIVWVIWHIHKHKVRKNKKMYEKLVPCPLLYRKGSTVGSPSAPKINNMEFDQMREENALNFSMKNKTFSSSSDPKKKP